MIESYVRWSEEDGEYVGLHRGYPSLSWLAPTPTEALRGIRTLVDQIIEKERV